MQTQPHYPHLCPNPNGPIIVSSAQELSTPTCFQTPTFIGGPTAPLLSWPSEAFFFLVWAVFGVFSAPMRFWAQNLAENTVKTSKNRGKTWKNYEKLAKTCPKVEKSILNLSRIAIESTLPNPYYFHPNIPWPRSDFRRYYTRISRNGIFPTPRVVSRPMRRFYGIETPYVPQICPIV